MGQKKKCFYIGQLDVAKHCSQPTTIKLKKGSYGRNFSKAIFFFYHCTFGSILFFIKTKKKKKRPKQLKAKYSYD